MLNKEKLYSFFVVIIIISQVFGLYGGALIAPRVIAILLMPFVLLALTKKDLKDVRLMVFIFVLLIFKTFYFLISDFMSFNSNNYIYLFVNIILVIELIVFSNKIDNLGDVIYNSWLLFLVFTLPIACIEIIFDWHLPVSYLEQGQSIGSSGMAKRFASVSFGNYNQFVFILCLIIPLLLSFFLKENAVKYSKRYKRYIIVCVIVSLLIILLNGSRGGLIASLISLILLVLFMRKKLLRNKVQLLKFLFLIVISASTGLYFILNSDIMYYILYRLTAVGYEDNTRISLIIAGWDLLVESNFVGIGAGNFMEKLNTLSYNVKELPPHNMIIELCTELGVFFFFLLSIPFCFSLIKGLKSNVLNIRYLVVILVIIFPIIFVINSVYVYLPYMWIGLTSYYLLIKNSSNEKR